MPLQYISRKIKKQEGDELSQVLESDAPQIVNVLLRSTLHLENKMIAAGVNFPFGGSLFAVAGKPG
jgi:hypothetical protein